MIPPAQFREPAPGDAIGNYRLKALIGAGGMGQVFLAERADGEIRQKVAIKFLRADAPGPAWGQRFAQERRLLASLNHPSIVHAIDAGCTPRGTPFLVMEFVHGLPIDEYALRVAIADRLRLFLRVCDAVAYAHRRLIVHRDLKPSNILVDAAGAPKLLDFGIAKLTGADADVSITQEALATPSYASPEQLRGDVQTTATDIYSLGAVLYKVLTGNSPKPSSPPPSRVHSRVPRDLDFVTAKALRPEPGERYASVDELAADVQAVLEARPVQARAGDKRYRARKFVRRYWVGLTATISAAAALAIGVGIANHERAIAERRFTDVRQLANKLFDVEYETRKLPGGSKTSQMVVDTSLEYLRRLEADLHGDPGLALDVGNAYLRVARVQGVPSSRNLGQMDQAAQSLRTGEAFIRTVLAAQPGNRIAILRLAQIYHDRMLLARYGGRYDEALALSVEASKWLDRFDAGPNDTAEASGVLSAYLNIADQNVRAEHYIEALRLCHRGRELTVVTNRPDYVPDFLWITADIYRRRGDLERALTDLDEAVRLSDPHGAPEIWKTMNFALSLIMRGELLGGDTAVSLGRNQDALDSLDRAWRLADDLAHRDPYDQLARSRLANAGLAMAPLLRDSDPARSLAIYDHTFGHLEEIPNNSSFRRFEVSALAGSTYPLRKLSRPGAAARRLEQAFERLRDLKLYPGAPFTLDSEVADSLRATADHEAATNNLSHAAEIYRVLIREAKPAKSSPETSLTDAVRLSTIYRGAAAVQRTAGFPAEADRVAHLDLELWSRWDAALPNSSFVRRQLGAARGNVRN